MIVAELAFPLSLILNFKDSISMDIYISELYSLDHNIHFLNRYIKFIRTLYNRYNKKPKGFHAHHILPASVFPQYKSFKENSWNRIYLSAEEHYVAHWLLHKALPSNPKMTHAFFQMCINPKTNNRMTSKTYAKIKDEHAALLKDTVPIRDLDAGVNLRVNREDLHLYNYVTCAKFYETPELLKARSEKNKNTFTVYNIISEIYHRISASEFDESIHIPTGKMRSQESKAKTSVALSDRIFYFNPETEHQLFLKVHDVIPDGYIKGLSASTREKMSKSGGGLLYYYNPLTNEQTKCVEGTEPAGYVRGRVVFSKSGVNHLTEFAHCYDLITKQFVSVKLDEVPDFMVHRNKKFIFSFLNFSSSSPDVIANKMNEYFNVDCISGTRLKSADIDFNKPHKRHKYVLADMHFTRVLKEDYIVNGQIWLKV